jgi:hypothetical protein
LGEYRGVEPRERHAEPEGDGAGLVVTWRHVVSQLDS